MDTSIGKRIAKQRKALGLTQDQLAEKIGITAQAVSKWENDLSCPDITILPKLADIFDTSTDELLGRNAPQLIPEVKEIPNTDKQENTFTYDSDNGEMNFHWKGAHLEGIGLACWVILTGILFLISRLIPIDVSFWNVLWPGFLLVFGAFGLYPKFSVLRLGCALTGAYFLLEKLHIISVTLDGGILIAVLLLLFGLALLADFLQKRAIPNRNKFTNHIHNKEFCNDYSTSGNSFSYDASFGDGEQMVTLATMGSGHISVNFGDFIVDLSGVTAVESACQLNADCNFGQLTIRIPRHFHVISAKSASFATLDVIGQPDADCKGTIHLNADVSFGSITICYI